MANLIPGEVPTWSSEGAKNNPDSGAALADTGAIAVVGTYLARVVVATDATAVLNLQWRNAANTANNKEQRLFYAANDRDGVAFPFRIDVANERLRIIPNTSVTGNACASIIWERVA